jgi:hypothetical protein
MGLAVAEFAMRLLSRVEVATGAQAVAAGAVAFFMDVKAVLGISAPALPHGLLLARCRQAAGRTAPCVTWLPLVASRRAIDCTPLPGLPEPFRDEEGAAVLLLVEQAVMARLATIVRPAQAGCEKEAVAIFPNSKGISPDRQNFKCFCPVDQYSKALLAMLQIAAKDEQPACWKSA